MSSRDNLRNQIALGWVSLLLVLVVMLLFMIVQSSFDNDDFTALRSDPGRAGLRVMTYLVGLYALMPVITYLIDALAPRVLRWLLVAAVAGNIVFMLLHHLSHWHAGQRATFNSHFLDLIYHLIGLWVLYCSIRWSLPERPLRSDA